MKMARDFYDELILSDEFAKATAMFFGINNWGDQAFIYNEALGCYLNSGDKVYTDDTETTRLRMIMYVEDVPDTEKDFICKIKTCTLNGNGIDKIIDENYATFKYLNGEWL
jgi:hypothetical protein